MLKVLKEEYKDDWWVNGIPTQCRKECVVRREEEVGGQNFPPEAYLSLIDLRNIAQKNWPLFQKACEQISGCQGKENATKWLQELNEMRKMWAHPIKKIFVPVEPIKIIEVRTLCTKVKQAISFK